MLNTLMTCLQPLARSGRLARFLLSAIALTALASCSSNEPAVDGSSTSTPVPPSASTTPSASTAASEPVPTSIQPSAQDGTNYKACLGGNCEIAVSKPVTITLSDSPVDLTAGPFTVRKVNAGSIEVRMALPAGPSLDVTIKKGCTTAFYGNNADGLAHTSCTREPEDILGMYIKQTVTVKSITDGTAILNLKSE
ncbi:hypothetical protein GCM10022225_56420 [Plantactinospora mayteni]|uniref:Lipoprotein n=1 Tax=Plantactinospora mayteni TaxID=566021 RepID=A0ABQ4EUJ8_9ACTN|nr:hypothetical protein [Plantactinospora mayteni]GIG98321.1 hypothetical protein Pma05_48940 [Plantactinospora mayteni]